MYLVQRWRYFFVIVPKKDDRTTGRRKWKERRNNRFVCCNEKSFLFLRFNQENVEARSQLPRNKSGTNWQAAFVSLFSNERRLHKLRKLMRHFNILVTRVTNWMSSGKDCWLSLLLLSLQSSSSSPTGRFFFTSLIKSRSAAKGELKLRTL